jgi:hypothetical protein
MKKMLVLAVIAVSLFLSQYAFAVATQNIVVTISINATVSLTSSSNAWNLTASSFSSDYISALYTITNDGSVNEQLKIQGADSGSTVWSMAAAPAANTFTVKALIGSNTAVAPVLGDFDLDGNDKLNNATPVSATATNLGDATWEPTNGSDVAPAGSRRLYLLFKTPTGGYTAQATIGTITLVVSADAL